MGRLHIQRFEDAGADGWALRFTGHYNDFMRMIEDLKSEYPDARFDPDLFDGRGGWIVEHSTLLAYAGADRFDNIWQLLHQEEDRRKAEQRRRSLAFEEKLARKLGIERDINEVPF